MHPKEADCLVRTSRAQRIARLALAVALALLGFWTLRGFLPAMIWAVIFTIATWPLYRRVRDRWPPGRHDILLPALFTTLIALVFILPLAFLAAQFAREALVLLQWAKQALSAGLPAPEWLTGLPFGGAALAEWWRDNLGSPEGASDLLAKLDRADLLAFGRHFGAQLLHRAVLFAFTILTLFFLFRDGERLAGQVLKASRRALGAHGEDLARQIVASVRGTVDGLVLVGLGEGALLGFVYALAGVPHPTLLGALTALAAMVPFGAPAVFGIAAVLMLTEGAVMAAAAVFGIGMAVLFVADHFIRPALIGGATRLPFLLVLVGILGGVESWGLLGLFVGPAIMAALLLLWRDWVEGAREDPPPRQLP